VVHAAQVTHSSPVLELDERTIAEALGPKLGGWLLHRLLSAEPLDFFVLFSSASTILSSPGMATDAMSNALLGCVADQRIADERPVLSILWGPQGEADMAPDAVHKNGTFEAVPAVSHAAARELMDLLWTGPESQPAVLPIDWASWKTRYRPIATDPLYRSLGNSAAHDSFHVDLPDLMQMAPAEQAALVAKWLGPKIFAPTDRTSGAKRTAVLADGTDPNHGRAAP
jgi:myxalamid-type polyketide synthase MxaE and MxaD